MTAGLLQRRPTAAPVALAVTVVGLQVAYPLVPGQHRDGLTVLIVIVFAAACVAHAVVSRGVRAGVTLLVLTAVPGLLVEVLGVHTGVPFGTYVYGSSSLGPRVWGVPVVIGLAWTMLAWPAAIVATQVASGFAARVVVGAWGLAAGDLFLDPQLVADGHWRWRSPSPHLPGVNTVPLSNYAGWLLVALVLSAGLQLMLRSSTAADDRLPIALFLWLYIGWIVALAGFLDLAAAAGWGAFGMGLVAVPLAVRLLR